MWPSLIGDSYNQRITALLQTRNEEAFGIDDFFKIFKTPVSQIEEIEDVWSFRDKTELVVMSFAFCDLQFGGNEVHYREFNVQL